MINAALSKTILQKQFIEVDSEALLETKVVAAYTSLSVSWFNNKAVYGGGIPYRKVGNKRLYQKQDVLDWLEGNAKKVTSTSEYKAPKND